jgi:plasmid stability protein
MLASVEMATLYVRNVPPDVYRRLRSRARENGRSINAEALEILTAAAALNRREKPIVDRLREIAREINLPPDAPRPEDLIRADRERH